MDYRYALSMKKRLAAAERDAQAAKHGIWSNVNEPVTIQPSVK
jgi:endonuclease YncB( thermonuclease family)